MKTASLVVGCVLALGCQRPSGHAGSRDQGVSGTSRQAAFAASVAEQCAASRLGLTNASEAVAWSFPQGCSPTSAGMTPMVIANEETFAQHFRCPNGVRSGVDFGRVSLVVTQRQLSPAGAGFRMYDDGHTATLVNVFRSPCPDDPRPMPGPSVTYAYLISAGEHQVAETTCTLPAQCN